MAVTFTSPGGGGNGAVGKSTGAADGTASCEHTGFHPQGDLMRRGIAATALVASLALAATACGGSDSGSDKSDGPTTITWWDTSNATNEAPTYKALAQQFEKANPGIKVKYVNVPFDQ